ncbi:hypothetical protein ABT282_10700 [Streptomyces sp. NPDC000927]|uniref:hypothetical protein n=1 Tax=unclassified Streptomyces TaxID=2593676 RepID=UPI003331620B
MSNGSSYHYGDNIHHGNNINGDNVNMYGGTGNTGIVKQQAPSLPEAIGELVRLLQELRGELAPASAQVIDDSLPAITSATSAPQERHRALIAVATIASTVGALGQPVADAVDKILGLLGIR